ncbi:MAG: cell division protein FtsA [bacterium]|nr:cell division protein FtsA [bacterium]
MGRPHIVTGIDIGNSFVKTVIAEFDRENLGPKILGMGIAESHGLRRGMVVNMDETIRDIAESVRKAETMAGAKVRRAYVAVNGLHIKSQNSRGVIAVSRADNEISTSDLERVIDAASIVSLPANREIIHIIPKNYVVDGQEQVKNPLGMKGVRLEAEVLIIDGLSPYIKNLAKCLNANDIEVAEFIFAPRAASYAVLDKNQMEHGVLNLDLGGGVSTLSFFHEGELVHASTMPVGSRHITNDLAVALRTSMDIAEEVKLRHGFTGVNLTSVKTKAAAAANKKDDIDLSEILGEEDFIIPRKNIGRVVEARVGEVFDMLQEEMKRVAHPALIPAGIVLTGGGAKLPGLAMFVKEKLKLPVRVGMRQEWDHSTREGEMPVVSFSDQAADPALAVAVGLAFYGIEREFAKSKSEGGGMDFGGSRRVFKNFFGRLKDFMP